MSLSIRAQSKNGMEIKICTTRDFNTSEWNSYVFGFNEVFGRNLSVTHFRQKYATVDGGTSYHALLKADKETVIGGIAVLPCRYLVDNISVKVGLAVDVFIRESFRDDPLQLRRMYMAIRKRLAEAGIELLIAVPNATAYPYWKNIVKWRDIGDIRYWILPKYISNILKINKCCSILNCCSILYVYTMLGCSRITALFPGRVRKFRFRAADDDVYLTSKLEHEHHITVTQKASSFTYCIADEEGVRTAYLLRTTRHGRRSAAALAIAASYLLRLKVDLILYVGNMGFFQTLFLKVPKRFEPKRLPLMTDIILPSDKFQEIGNMELWDFGLINYDVR